MFCVNRYYIKAEKMAEYQKWLLSNEAKLLYKRLEKETGWKYLETYFTVLGFGGDYVEDWWEIPNWASLDKSMMSKVNQEMSDATWDFPDYSRGYSSAMYRAARDVQVFAPPKKKK
ncbi:MAG TPA: hypothetical protein VJ574_06360 [Candidatus Bathyarchaeia archaeon]|nr:hypothetical protein [Candidatus Bathyarchaeia archaeon]